MASQVAQATHNEVLGHDFVYFSLTQFGVVLDRFVAATIALGSFGGAFLTGDLPLGHSEG